MYLSMFDIKKDFIMKSSVCVCVCWVGEGGSDRCWGSVRLISAVVMSSRSSRQLSLLKKFPRWAGSKVGPSADVGKEERRSRVGNTGRREMDE